MNDTTENFPENVFLVVNSQLFTIQKTVTNIGRNPQNDLIINEPGISRVHAEIRYEDGKFLLNDLGSTNGTFVNDTLVVLQEIHSGDTITLGRTPILFIDRSDSPLIRQAMDSTASLSEDEDFTNPI